jgi:hypothetical protein
MARQEYDTIRVFGEELRQQYTVGYYPPAHGTDKEVHDVRITTRDRNRHVRARKVYATD